MRKRGLSAAVVLLLTFGLYLLLYWLASGRGGGTARLDPIVVAPVAGNQDVGLQLNPVGLIGWLVIVALYGWTVVRLLSRWQGEPQGFWISLTGAIVVSWLYVAIVHPSFLLFVSPAIARLMAQLPPISDIYYFGGIRRYAVPVVLIHAAVVYLLLATIGSTRWRRSFPEAVEPRAARIP